MRNPYRSPAIEQRLNPFRNVNMLAGTKNLPEFFKRKRRACLVKARQLEKNMVYCLKKKAISSFELRKCLSLAFRKYIRISRPTCRPQLKRNKCSRVGASNRCVFFTTVKNSVQEHPDQFQTIAVHCISTSNDSGTLISLLDQVS